MIEPPKLTVFLVVVTAHLAVLAFGFPNMRTASEGAGSQPASSWSSTNLAAVDKTPLPTGSATGSDSHNKYGADGDHDHGHGDGDVSHPSAAPTSANSSATRAGHRSHSDSDGPVDTVPTLEEHRRQHGHDDHDLDNEPQLVDLERIAHNDTKQIPAGIPQADEPKGAESQRPAPAQLAVAPTPPALKPLPVAGDESRADVPARPTPVQLIIPEKSEAKPPVSKSTLKPVAKPIASAKAPEPPRARPVANSPKPVAPTSNRAGSSRMKNLRPIKKP